jgi:uncharacterized heparinase superfamily protein
LEGEDVFARDAAAAPVEAAIRFHLMPGVKASRAQTGQAAMLVLPNGEAWRFDASAPELRIEESVFFAAPHGMRRTEQIVLAVRPAETAIVRWSFERLERRRPARPGNGGQQPELL